MRKLLILSAVLFAAVAHAASVDTASVYSKSMHKEIKCVVVKPDVYENPQLHFPVVYLLHGYSDRYDTWVRKVPAIKACADRMQMIIVCPDGGYSSWYFDSPVDTSCRYETFVSLELVTYMDAHYHTVADRDHRAIAGLSMGGHGALFLALRHSGIFGAAGSMSGGVDLRPFPRNWDIAKRIGDYRSHRENWEKMSVVNLVGPYPSRPLAIMLDCGTDDFFCKVNRQLHLKMLKMRIPHDYVERPGSHSWDYWSNAIEYQLLFFHRYFQVLQKN